MSNVASNRVYVANDWRDYERLPATLREVVRRAPYNLATKRWMAGLPSEPRAARKALVDRIVGEMRVRVRETYGSDHPQAAPSPAPVAPEWERPKRKGGRHAARA